MNVKLDNISVVNIDSYPQLIALKNIFIRGSVIRYVHIDPNDVNVDLLQDATRRDFLKQQQQTSTTSSAAATTTAKSATKSTS